MFPSVIVVVISLLFRLFFFTFQKAVICGLVDTAFYVSSTISGLTDRQTHYRSNRQTKQQNDQPTDQPTHRQPTNELLSLAVWHSLYNSKHTLTNSQLCSYASFEYTCSKGSPTPPPLGPSIAFSTL